MLLWPQDRLLRADQGFDQICAVLEVADTLRACGFAASLCSEQMICLCCYSRYDASRCRLTAGLTGAHNVLIQD